MSEKVFSIIIPAYNEEDAIRSTLERVTEAREKIVSETDIDAVEVIVVSDGSSDATADIVSDYAKSHDVRLIAYEKNRGYGSAIKTGFSEAKGDYVSFFDADGTCDPNFFVELYNLLENENAQIALGSRVHKKSKMPLVRRIGNKIYVALINLLWSTRISDSASGMRIIRTEALNDIYPLPDGLHFTPTMTCKALSLDNVKIVEIDMPYEERSGRSKLSVVKDGYRFLKTIFEIGFSYRPFMFFGTIGIVFFVISACYGLPVVIYYIKSGTIAEEMIYRIIAVVTGIVVGSILFFVNLIMQDFIAYAKGRALTFEKTNNALIKGVTSPGNIVIAGGILLLAGTILVLGSIKEYLLTGAVSQHWIYTMTSAFLLIEGTIVFVFGVAQQIIHVYKKQF